MLKKKDKKGILLAETVLKIVIAVLCIVVLVILAGKLFGIFSKENQVRKAGDNLNLIAEKIALLTGNEYTENFLYVAIYPPEGKWFMRNFRKEEGFPEKQCVVRFESCLCMCEGVDCVGLKACKGFEKEIIIDAKYTEPPSPYSGLGPGPAAYVPSSSLDHEGVIQFEASIEELKISKEDESEIIKISKSDRA